MDGEYIDGILAHTRTVGLKQKTTTTPTPIPPTEPTFTLKYPADVCLILPYINRFYAYKSPAAAFQRDGTRPRGETSISTPETSRNASIHFYETTQQRTVPGVRVCVRACRQKGPPRNRVCRVCFCFSSITTTTTTTEQQCFVVFVARLEKMTNVAATSRPPTAASTPRSSAQFLPPHLWYYARTQRVGGAQDNVDRDHHQKIRHRQ